jgi:hypothetical protein
LRHNEIRPQSLHDIKNPRDVIDERNVYGFDLRPKGKSAVGDDQSVGVPYAAQKRIDGGI